SAPPSVTHCLECNAPLSPAETQGLCARCLLKMGLASRFGESSVAGAGARKFIPPPLFPFDFGGYRVLRLLGRGGMGAVYEAEQHDTGRRVALKVLGHTIDSPEMRKRFLREGRLAASVNHPNSVYIFGTEEIEGAPVIAMELVAGGTLRDRIRNGPLPVREAVDAILQIIAGLEAAASAGVLHRDVKPANCFVAPDGTAKVGDFGLSVSTLARSDTQLTASGVMLGTPSYAPPEQLRGDELDVRADIYSVGATLYSLLTGRAPFEGDNAVQVVAAVLDKVPPPVANVPAGLAQIVARCLAKKRDDRFADYAALRDALLPFSSDVPEPAPLGLRFIANGIDEIFAQLPAMIALGMLGLISYPAWIAQGTPQALLGYAAALLAAILYYAFCEGRFGAGVGKAVCGLRVVGEDGSAPGFRHAFGRACITELALQCGSLFAIVLLARGTFVYHSGHWVDYVFIPVWGALIITMRRRNGFAAVQDLATGTRVVVRSKVNARPRLEAPAPPAPPADGERLGPYVLGEMIAGGAFRTGYDDVLRRRVWIRQQPAGAPSPSDARREVSRATRLRW
ncbi:MAG: protein kinase, partial [Chthoniobacteraceae bacterium]